MNPDYYFTAVAMAAILCYIIWKNDNDPRSS